MTTESRVDPEVRRFLITTLLQLDNVRTDDGNFWPTVSAALESLESALLGADPSRLAAAVREVGRTSEPRANPVGSAPRPMPGGTRAKRNRLLHLLGGAGTSASTGGAGGSGPSGGNAGRKSS